jgi:class 3 adenylate cyclase
MRIFFFTKKEAELKKLAKELKTLKGAIFLAPPLISKHSPEADDLSYLDLGGYTSADAVKAVSLLKKRCKNSSWGIIDPKGSKDPAHWFFEGASDYIGQTAFKEINVKRFKAAVSWRNALAGVSGGKAENAETDKKSGSGIQKTGIKLPPGKFPGWTSIPTGKTIPVYLLYVSLQGKTALNSRLGEKAYAQLNKRLLAYLYQNFQEAEGLVWMETGKDFLLLFPPKAKSGQAMMVACIRMLLSAPMIALETLGLGIPVNFVFALHYGSVAFKPPGKTGTVVSDAVNFIFHLGSKRAETGRLTVSGGVPDGTIPEGLKDLFVDAGEFEGNRTWHTRKFSYPKSWV